MVAVDTRLRDTWLMDTSVDAEEMAHELLETADRDWIRRLLDELDRQVRIEPLERLTSLWDLSNAAAARIFGVSRQAFSKWLVSGPPADRVDEVAVVDNITSLLDRYVKRERIPAVVRRSADRFEGRSLLEVLEAGEYELAAAVMTETFDIRRVQP
jgi:hypothetical protein